MARRPLARERSLARRRPTRQPRERFLLLCEGEVTEPGYFKYVRTSLRDTLLAIEISKERGDPLQLVQAAVDRRASAAAEARRARDDNLRFDQVWCVFDVDEHHRLDESLELAQKQGVRVALSNPSFELWPVLHFADHRSFASAASLAESLRQHMPSYDKELDCHKLRGKFTDARQRAEDLRRQHDGNGKSATSNPATDVPLLVTALLDAALKAGGRAATAAHGL